MWKNSQNYTEHQNTFTSSERHTLKSKASEWIIFGLRLALVILVILLSTSKKQKQWFAWVKKEKTVKSVFKKHRNCSPPGLGVVANKCRYHWNRVNSYWMFWIGCLCGSRSVNSFCDFWKNTFCDFTAFFSFLTQANLYIFRCSYWSIKAYIQILLILMLWILVSIALKNW